MPACGLLAPVDADGVRAPRVQDPSVAWPRELPKRAQPHQPRSKPHDADPGFVQAVAPLPAKLPSLHGRQAARSVA